MKSKNLIKKVLKKSRPKDFWSSLSPAVKARIEQGLSDVDSGRYSPAKSLTERLISE